MKLLVEYMTGHFFDLYEAANDFLQVLPGSPCVPEDRPALLRWPMAGKKSVPTTTPSDVLV